MGNLEEDSYGQSPCMCNIFEIQKKSKRNSLSLPRNNNINTKKFSKNLKENEIMLYVNQIENGAKPLNTNNTNKYNNTKNGQLGKLKKFILLNSKTKDNNRYTVNNSQNDNNYQNSTILKNIKYNKDSIEFEDENTINNNSLDSIDSIKKSKRESKNTNNKVNEVNEIKEVEKNNNILNENIHYEQQPNEIEIKEKNTNKLNENNINVQSKEIEEKEIEKKEIEKKEIENKEIEKKEKDNKNLIKDFKKQNNNNNYKFNERAISETDNQNKRLTQIDFKRPKLKKSESTKNNRGKKHNYSFSIPEIHHQEKNHALNLLLIKKQIISYKYPLNKNNSFNIIIYKEDNSKQYSYFKNGLASGATKYIIDKNIIFEGEFEDGYPKGYGKFTLLNECRYYEGIWDKSIMIGIESWKDGTLYIGEFRDNKKEGVGMYRWPDGTIYYGELKNDNMEGFCLIKFVDDRKYEGQILNGLKNGYGEFTWKNIRKYIGNYVNDLKEGFGIYVWNIKIFEIYIGFWFKGKMEGIGMIINEDKKHFGKWSKGKKIESFKNIRDIKLKYSSEHIIISPFFINRKMNKNNSKINRQSIKQNFDINVNEAKFEFDRCINFMSKDIKSIKSFVMSFFFKSNEFS